MASTDTARNPTGRFAEQQLRFGSQYSATATQIEASFRESQTAGCKGINWQKLRKLFTDNNGGVGGAPALGNSADAPALGNSAEAAVGTAAPLLAGRLSAGGVCEEVRR